MESVTLHLCGSLEQALINSFFLPLAQILAGTLLSIHDSPFSAAGKVYCPLFPPPPPAGYLPI